MREVIIFGNGVGMALDADSYRLETALKKAWEDPDSMDDAQREMMKSCISADDLIETETAEYPRSESELGTLQRVVAACDIICQSAKQHEHWLTPQGKVFPDQIRGFVHRVACILHDQDMKLAETFVGPLKDHILDQRSHIATLNYDKLIYNSFTGTPVMKRYECLIDGFHKKKGEKNLSFNANNLTRHRPAKQSFYMHLHGSPLFITQPDGNVTKLPIRKVEEHKGNASTHLVLTHFDYKQAVIVASPILKEYWAKLAEAFDEADGVTLFGYSGADKHLNKLISSKNFKRIRVIEYRGEKTVSVEAARWKSRLRGNVEVVLLDSILSFTDW